MIGQGFGILIEIWKINKTVDVRLQRTNGIIPYKIIFDDKHTLSEKEAETQEYDKIAFVRWVHGCANGRHICTGQEFRFSLLTLCTR